MEFAIAAAIALALPITCHAEFSISFASLADGAQGLLYEPTGPERDASIYVR